MKRFGHLLLGALLLLAPRIAAATPDELFLQVYNLIEQGNLLKQNGRDSEAQAKYREAYKGLMSLKNQYPYWKPQIVEYREDYLEERIGKPTTAAPPVPADATKAPDRSGTSVPLPNPEIVSLKERVQQLEAAKAKLEARLREALTARPAAIDPHELGKAQARITALQKENAELKAKLGTAPAPAAGSPDAQALEQARKAAADLSQALETARNQLAAVEKERDALTQQVSQLQAQTSATPAPAPTPAPPVAPSADAAELAKARKSVADLTQALADEKARAAGLDNQLKEAQAAAQASKSSAAEQQKLKDLESERDALRARVTVLTRQLDEQKLARGDQAAKQLSEQLSVLRARIQVYEAQAVPYTKEEMALMSSEPKTEGLVDRTRLPASELPAGVAGLVTDAERAFRAERYDEAEAKYLQALAADENNVHLLANLAACQLQQNKLAAAEATLKKALAQDSMDPDALSLQGLLEFRQENYEAAEKTLSLAAEVNPESALTQNYLGVTLSQKGLRKQAETAFRKAIQIDPNYAEAHYNLAVVYARQEPAFPALARYHYEKAIAGGQPRNPELEKIISEAEKK